MIFSLKNSVFILCSALLFFGFLRNSKADFRRLDATEFFEKHDFHTSLTEINYNTKTDALEMTMRLFIDDFEKVLTLQNGNKKVQISDSEASDSQIETYVRKHLAFISPNKQLKPLQYLGKEIEADAVWLYIEVPNATSLKGYNVYNILLLEEFEDQTNLMNFIYPSAKKTLVFNQKTKLMAYPF